MELESGDLLFSERLAPITTSMGFIEADMPRVVTGYTEWQREIAASWDPGSNVDAVEVTGRLEDVLKSILPFQRVHSNRALFIPTQGRWVAYVANNFRGTDPSAIGYMARLLACRSLWIVANPHSLKRKGIPRIGRQGALIFELYGPEKTDWLNRLRIIRLENNAGKWEFTLEGEPLSFEDLEQYEASRVSDRMSFSTFSRYLGTMGIHPFSSDFFLPPDAGPAFIVRTHWRQKRLIHNVSFKRARRLNRIEEGLRICGRLISREGYF
jgi:hypothetical protein